MDTLVSLLNSQTSQFLIGQDADEGKDIISNLPDNILLHILTFLPIKDVLRTSVLSTRWKHLWISISHIDFDDTGHNLSLGMRASLLDSLDRVLRLHDPSCIRRFRFRCGMDAGASHVSSWISKALNLKVQELDLSLPALALFELPDSLFISDTLSTFELKMDIFFKVPSFTHFSNLKSLCLREVVFQDDRSTEHLFSGCPVLQKLVLYKCVLKNIKRITLSIPTLRTLAIHNPCVLDYYLHDCVIVVYAENLISLECISCVAIDFLLCNLSSLRDVYIDEQTFGYQNGFFQRATNLIGGIHNVKSLTLSDNILQCLSFDENCQARLPIFHSLTRLKVIPRMFHSTRDLGLMYFLHKSPNVESLEIPEVFRWNKVWLLNPIPECLKSCIKTISISYFEGNYREVFFLKYLLENADILQRVTIVCGNDLATRSGKLKEINHELQAIHSCVIQFLK